MENYLSIPKRGDRRVIMGKGEIVKEFESYQFRIEGSCHERVWRRSSIETDRRSTRCGSLTPVCRDLANFAISAPNLRYCSQETKLFSIFPRSAQSACLTLACGRITHILV